MPYKNLVVIIFIAVFLTSVFYSSLDNLTHSFQKITGYTSIIIQATVEPPPASPTAAGDTTLTATVAQPQQEEPAQTTQSATVAQTASPIAEPAPKQYIDSAILVKIVNQTEKLKIDLDGLRSSSREVLNHYSSVDDTKNVEKWVNVIVHFNQVLLELENIQTYAETVKDSATQEDIGVIKEMVADVIKTTNKIGKLIKSE